MKKTMLKIFEISGDCKDRFSEIQKAEEEGFDVVILATRQIIETGITLPKLQYGIDTGQVYESGEHIYYNKNHSKTDLLIKKILGPECGQAVCDVGILRLTTLPERG